MQDNGSSEASLSIILNVHREANFLTRTLDSFDEAVRYAASFNISCEIIVVEDRPDQATIDFILNRNFSAYADHHVIQVDNGSLGLSRNDGIDHAHGRFIMTADADDLVSFNIISENFFAAASCRDKVLFFPQYYLAFGTDPHLYECSRLTLRLRRLSSDTTHMFHASSRAAIRLPA